MLSFSINKSRLGYRILAIVESVDELEVEQGRDKTVDVTTIGRTHLRGQKWRYKPVFRRGRRETASYRRKQHQDETEPSYSNIVPAALPFRTALPSGTEVFETVSGRAVESPSTQGCTKATKLHEQGTRARRPKIVRSSVKRNLAGPTQMEHAAHIKARLSNTRADLPKTKAILLSRTAKLTSACVGLLCYDHRIVGGSVVESGKGVELKTPSTQGKRGFEFLLGSVAYFPTCGDMIVCTKYTLEKQNLICENALSHWLEQTVALSRCNRSVTGFAGSRDLLHIFSREIVHCGLRVVCPISPLVPHMLGRNCLDIIMHACNVTAMTWNEFYMFSIGTSMHSQSLHHLDPIYAQNTNYVRNV